MCKVSLFWKLILLQINSFEFFGGDLTAGSPTVTLLQLNPPHRTLVRLHLKSKASLKPRLDGLTGGVCKERGHIHRAMMTRDY